MEFIAETRDGKMAMGNYYRSKFVDFLKKNNGVRIKISPIFPESPKLRRYFEGAIIPLITFYQENMDHRDSEDRVRDWLKIEMNGELVVINGVQRKMGKSTKGAKTLKRFTENVLDWLIENYQPPEEALDPEKYKEWIDTVYPYGGPDNYIDYLVEIGILKKI